MLALQPVSFRPPRFVELSTASEVLQFAKGETLRAFGFWERKSLEQEAPLVVGFVFVNGRRAFVFRRELDGDYLRPRLDERITQSDTDPYFSPRLSYPLAQLNPWPAGVAQPANARSESCTFSVTLAETMFCVILQIGHRIFTYERPIEELLFTPLPDEPSTAIGSLQPVTPQDLVWVRESRDPTLIRVAFQEHSGYLGAKLPGSELPLTWWVVASGRMDLLEVVLELGAELNTPLPKIGCPLHVAASHGFPDMIERLVEAGADPNVANLKGETPLHRALRSSTREPDRDRLLGVYDQLVRLGANDDIRNGDLRSPRETRWLLAFHRAVAASDIEQVRAFLEDPIGKDGRLGSPVADVRGSSETAFNLAVSTGELGMMELLFPHTQGQASVDAALWVAIGYRRLGAAAWLIERGADSRQVSPVKTQADGTTTGGTTPLHHAADDTNRRMAELLLKCGADVNAFDRDGSTPTILASKRPFGHKTVALLIDHGADLTVRDSSGKTALDYATRWRESRTVEVLTKASE